MIFDPTQIRKHVNISTLTWIIAHRMFHSHRHYSFEFFSSELLLYAITWNNITFLNILGYRVQFLPSIFCSISRKYPCVMYVSNYSSSNHRLNSNLCETLQPWLAPSLVERFPNLREDNTQLHDLSQNDTIQCLENSYFLRPDVTGHFWRC